MRPLSALGGRTGASSDVGAAGRSGCPARGPRRRGKSPSRRWPHSPSVSAPPEDMHRRDCAEWLAAEGLFFFFYPSQRCGYLVWSDFVVDFLNADFSGPDIATLHRFVITLTGQNVQSEWISVVSDFVMKHQTALWA